ncbi:MAG: DUF2357 domain-containing protein [Thermomicrobiales bacterium]
MEAGFSVVDDGAHPLPGAITIVRWDRANAFSEAHVAAALAAYHGLPHRPACFLHEWATYRVTVAGADELVVGSTRIGPLIAGHDVFEVRFENQLGFARIQPMKAGRHLGPGMAVEVIAEKFATPLESLAFTDGLLLDLFARQMPMPFQVAAPTGRLVREARRPPNLLFAYHFFRRYGQDLMRAMQAIAHRPLRRLHEVYEDVRLVEASDIDLDAMLSVLRGATHNDLSEQRIAHRLRPERVRQRRPIETLDVPENRFVLDVARRMLDWADSIPEATWYGRVPEADRIRLAALRGALRAFVRDRQFTEVGPLVRIPAESRVLQRRDGYRELTRLWFAFQRARQPLFDRLEHAIDIRDIATLYEYWVFFELADRIGAALDLPGTMDAVGDGVDGLRHRFACRFGTAGTLVYNWSERGYSGVRLRPDYVWIPAEGVRVAFDAKFRMVASTSPAVLEDGELPAGVSYDPKDDDLVKMHAYRDALGVRAAVVLYPGTSATFRPAAGTIAPTTVADVVLNEGLSGVSEIGMSPLVMGGAL